MRSVRTVRPRWSRLAILWLLVLSLFGGLPSAQAAGATWHVNKPGDDATNGDLAAHSGSLRFVLEHAVSGDVVMFGETGSDFIYVSSTLVVPAGVAVGGARNEANCGDYHTPRANIEDGPLFTLRPVISLGAGASLHGINIGGGDLSVKVIGADVDICGVGIGIVHDGDGYIIPLLPAHTALAVDGAHATVRHNYLGGAVVISSHGSDTRIGDSVSGSGDANDGIRDAAVTVLTNARDIGGLCANSTAAAQRVTIRDRFPRGLACIESPGVSGGDDVASHVNNWAETPTIFGATTSDGQTVEITGAASPLSVVDLYLDYALEIDSRTTTADANGLFSYSGPLPQGDVRVYAASTLADPAHPGRVGSSSEWSGGTAVISSTNPPLLSALGSTIDLSRVESGPAHPGDLVRFTITMANIGSVDLTNINSTVFQASPTVTILANSSKISGGSGFIATDAGFSNGTLAPGQVAIYSLDALVGPTDKPALASLSMEVNADGIIATPVRAFMPIVVDPAPARQPRVWLALALGG